MEARSDRRPRLPEVEEAHWSWWECQLDPEATYPEQEPASPVPGQIWYDPEEQIYYVWVGTLWREIPQD